MLLASAVRKSIHPLRTLNFNMFSGGDDFSLRHLLERRPPQKHHLREINQQSDLCNLSLCDSILPEGEYQMPQMRP